MKNIKVWGVIAAFLISSVSVFAADCDTSMCKPAPYPVSGAVTSTLSKVSGMNWLLSSIIQSQVKKQADKALMADFNVRITPFGAKNLIDGKFKKITLHSDSAYLEGFYLSDVNAESVCPFNHFIYKNGQVYTNENFLLSYNVSVTSNDLQKTISTPQYLRLLNSMNVSVGNMTMFKVLDPKAEVKNGRLVFSLKILSPLTFGEPKQISTSMGLEVCDGKIIFTDVRTSPALATVNLNAILPIINKLNPFTYKAGILNNPKSIIKVKDIKLSDNKILIKGLVIVPKNYYNN